MTDRLNVGFAGLGAIGHPMAARCAAAHHLTVWNRTPERAAQFAADHPDVRVAHTLRELAEGADAVITCLPTSAEVESLLDGSDGLLAGLRPGSLLVDCTSGDPATSRRIATRLASGRFIVLSNASGTPYDGYNL